MGDLDPDLAAQMGFASFGAQPTAKKRKYNSATDAVTCFSTIPHPSLPKKPPPVTGANRGAVASGRGRGEYGGVAINGSDKEAINGLGHQIGSATGEEVGNRGKAGGRVLGGGGRRARGGRGGMEMGRGDRDGPSGSNSTPLGSVASRDSAESGSRGLDVALGLGGREAHEGTMDDEDDTPGYIEDTPPGSPLTQMVTAFSNAETKAREAERVMGLARSPVQNILLVNQASNDAEADVTTSTLPSGALPVRPQRESMSQGRYDWAALRRGVRNERGDVAYYDASFVEDPWKDLIAKAEEAEAVRDPV
ncbi:hypothetical protein MMC13_006049 [Lambiella insularis]|nr:hypothetical protein [Lambiella insularis]